MPVVRLPVGRMMTGMACGRTMRRSALPLVIPSDFAACQALGPAPDHLFRPLRGALFQVGHVHRQGTGGVGNLSYHRYGRWISPGRRE